MGRDGLWGYATRRELRAIHVPVHALGSAGLSAVGLAKAEGTRPTFPLTMLR
jgi:hypothetical protein